MASVECDPIIEVKGLYINFYTYAGVLRAIDGVSFTVCRGEVYCIVGETGCGKSVTAKALTGLIYPPGRIESGSIKYYPEPGSAIEITRLGERDLRKIRGAEISYVFQDPSAALDPLYTIGHQVAETMKAHGLVSSIKEGMRRAVEVLRRALMPDPHVRAKSYPHELSGGMKQRGVIGISLANKPKVLIADEPTTALDVTIQAQIMETLMRLKEEEGLTLILITHNMGLVAQVCDRVAVMYAGRIVEEAPLEEIFRRPQHPYTQALLKAVPNPLARVERLESIPGTVPDLVRPPRGCRFHPRCPYFMDKCVERPPNYVTAPGHKVACWLYSGSSLAEESG